MRSPLKGSSIGVDLRSTSEQIFVPTIEWALL